jgi:hypothetical protein
MPEPVRYSDFFLDDTRACEEGRPCALCDEGHPQHKEAKEYVDALLNGTVSEPE